MPLVSMYSVFCKSEFLIMGVPRYYSEDDWNRVNIPYKTTCPESSEVRIVWKCPESSGVVESWRWLELHRVGWSRPWIRVKKIGAMSGSGISSPTPTTDSDSGRLGALFFSRGAKDFLKLRKYNHALKTVSQNEKNCSCLRTSFECLINCSEFWVQTTPDDSWWLQTTQILGGTSGCWRNGNWTTTAGIRLESLVRSREQQSKVVIRNK